MRTILQHRADQVVGIRRTAGQIDGGHAAQQIGDADRARGIVARRWQSAPRSARADGDDRACLGADLFQHLGGRLSGQLHVDALLLRRNRAFDHQKVLAGVASSIAMRRALLGLLAGAGHQGLVVVERDDVEDEIVHAGTRGAQQRLGAAGAVLEVQPDHRGPLHLRMSAATSPAHDFFVSARPMGATIISSVQNFRKSRRGIPARRSCSPMVEVLPWSSFVTIDVSPIGSWLAQTNVRISLCAGKSVLSGRKITV